MEIQIPARVYFSFWALIGLTFLFYGFHTSNKSGLSDSVSPVVLSLFGHSLAISIFHSSYYALLSRHLPKIPNLRKFFCIFFIGHMVSYPGLVGIGMIFRCKDKFAYLYNLYCIILQCHQLFFEVTYKMTSPIIFLVAIFLVAIFQAYVILELKISLDYGKTKLFPFLIILISNFTSLLWAQDPNWWTMNINKIEMKKFIQFAVGAAGTILFQYSFKLTSLDHVKVFFCYTIVWLANLALLRPCYGDFGIFTFLLGNVIVGCTVNLFSLGGTTWFTYGACVFLYGLRLTLESLSLVDIQGREVIVLFGKENLAHSQPENLTHSEPADRALVIV